MIHRFGYPFIPLLLIALCIAGLRTASAAEQPNILWITAEDMSATLGCYGDEYAITPNIDKLATESVRYTHAFATAPVCSPSRSCLITGCYAPSLGTMQMRSAFPIPEKMTGFPSVLRDEIGYYTTNNVKTDYNNANWKNIVAASWDESSAEAHWRKNPDKSKPFFSVFNLMTSHQSRSMVWPTAKFVEEVQSRLSPEEIHDPAEAPLPPYYVDTPIVRREWARLYDCVTAMDKEVGAILKQLEEDGLAEDTIVFFYSDHGSGMPRHKRALLDSGMHVPLMIRFPEKFRSLAPNAPGTTVGDLVSFVDFGPTVLSLAGASIPDFMQGQPFLGGLTTRPPRQYVYGHRDRVDEAIDLGRSVRDKRWLYIRNYMPHRSYNQPTAWPDSGEIRHEFYRLTDREKMTEAQWHFAGPVKAAEELFDCEADPLNLSNLADSAEHRETLERLRTAHRDHLSGTNDTGFIPESRAWEIFDGTTPWEGAGKMDLEPIRAAADAVGREDDDAVFLSQLKNADPSIRYWGAVGLAASPLLSPPAREALVDRLNDGSAAVRIEAASAVSRHGQCDVGVPVLIGELENDNLTAVLHAARSLELLGDRARDAVPAMEKLVARCEEIRPPDTPATVVTSGEQDLAMFIAFSANAFLAALPEEESEQKEEESAWIDLFDGNSLDGWTALAEGEVTVEEGEIRILAKGKNLWLLHGQEYGNFELQAEVKMPDDDYNSGIGFRCLPSKGKPKGYQCEVAGAITGKIYAIGSGWVWPKGKEEEQRFREMAGASFNPDDWNAIRIRCEGDHIRIWVNDTLTADVHDSTFAKGSVALQHHGKGGVHRFRNIRLQELP